MPSAVYVSFDVVVELWFKIIQVRHLPPRHIQGPCVALHVYTNSLPSHLGRHCVTDRAGADHVGTFEWG